MIIRRKIQVSKPYLERSSNEGRDRIKMDVCQAAGLEYYERNRSNMELKMVEKESNEHQSTFEFEFVIFTKDEMDKILNDFQRKFGSNPGVGAAKVEKAVQILVELMVAAQ